MFRSYEAVWNLLYNEFFQMICMWFLGKAWDLRDSWQKWTPSNFPYWWKWIKLWRLHLKMLHIWNLVYSEFFQVICKWFLGKAWDLRDIWQEWTPSNFPYIAMLCCTEYNGVKKILKVYTITIFRFLKIV